MQLKCASPLCSQAGGSVKGVVRTAPGLFVVQHPAQTQGQLVPHQGECIRRVSLSGLAKRLIRRRQTPLNNPSSVNMRARHKIIIANTLFSAFYHSLAPALRAVKGCRRRLALAARDEYFSGALARRGTSQIAYRRAIFCTQQTLFITSLRTTATVCNCTNLFQKTAFISSVCHRRTTFVITFSARRHNSNLNMKCWEMRCYQRETKFWLCFASLGFNFLKNENMRLYVQTAEYFTQIHVSYHIHFSNTLFGVHVFPKFQNCVLDRLFIWILFSFLIYKFVRKMKRREAVVNYNDTEYE